MRRLDEEQLGIFQEEADRLAQEGAKGSVVGVEYGNEFALRGRHAGIEIAGLGLIVARARDLANAQALGERLQRRAATLRGQGYSGIFGVDLGVRPAVRRAGRR